MSRHLYAIARRKFSHLSRSICVAATVLGATQIAMAGPTVDQLSDCLVKATTASDKTTVLQWTFTALAAHPDLKAFSNVTPEQKDQLDQKLAQVLQRIIVEQCSAQTKAVIQAEGVKQSAADAAQQSLWHYDVSPTSRQAHTLTFIPWFSWANRGEGEMRIWINEQ